MSDELAATTILLVGPGRAGSAFARSWTRAGGAIVVLARDPARARALARELDRVDVVPLEGRGPLSGDVLMLAVPDDAIAPLAAALAPRVACRFAFHFSGALPGAAMSPLEGGGTLLGSLHPLRAFSGEPGEDWSGSFVAVEGEEESAAAEAIRIARTIGARPHRVAARAKPLYHAAATLAAGGTASLLSVAALIWEDAGLDEEAGRVALAELAAGATAAVARLPFDRALTGPVARRDTETIRLHAESLARLARRPEAARLYALLARETLRRTPNRGLEPEITAVLAALERQTEPPRPESDEKSENPAPKG